MTSFVVNIVRYEIRPYGVTDFITYNTYRVINIIQHTGLGGSKKCCHKAPYFSIGDVKGKYLYIEKTKGALFPSTFKVEVSNLWGR